MRDVLRTSIARVGLGTILFLSACSFSKRSGAFECSASEPCTDSNRVCSDGWCVLPGEGTPDGMVDVMADAFVCPVACTRCEAEVCVIECSTTDSCPEEVQCPAGVACQVECSGNDSCGNGIDCTMASECRLSCTGVDSCAQKIDCGAGLCSIACSGAGSCPAGLDCSDSCDCNVTCADNCGLNECPGSAACVKDGLCTNGPGSCRTCP